jgi:hypothetical protein
MTVVIFTKKLIALFIMFDGLDFGITYLLEPFLLDSFAVFVRVVVFIVDIDILN